MGKLNSLSAPAVSDARNVYAVLAEHIANPATAWSVGCFGAIAEFMRDAGEPFESSRFPQAISAFTDRGAIRLLTRPDARLFASEGLTRDSWSQRVSVCLPRDTSTMNRRAVLTALGPDDEAIRDADRGGALFDLGLNAFQVDACVRVSDPSLARALADLSGRPVFDHDNPAMGLILKASPHRVFISRVGRAEVYQRIPPPDGKSPEGPHTHVLPKLLRNGLTHAATEPVPTGWIPCAHLYPAHPARDGMGVPHAYDARLHEAFQALLMTFGDPETVGVKTAVAEAVRTGRSPEELPHPTSRHARSAIRVCLRQLRAGGLSAGLAAWQAAYDRPLNDDADFDDATAPGHG
jgi:hypothetical protein